MSESRPKPTTSTSAPFSASMHAIVWSPRESDGGISVLCWVLCNKEFPYLHLIVISSLSIARRVTHLIKRPLSFQRGRGSSQVHGNKDHLDIHKLLDAVV